ncbi:MAG: YfhO family protein [Candidatus Saganbacteria bacterium]|nr:YfhO family protein [Candidatus Saganbacteria bacterium]
MKINKKDSFIYCVFAVFALLLFYPFLDGKFVFGFKDLSRYFYPLRHFMVEQAKSGIVPLWNPYLFCGYPFLASLQIGFFYPFSIIFYFLPFNFAFNYYIVIHYFLAALFTYFLMRHYSVSRPASFLAGLVFAFSGYLLSISNMNTTLSSVIWLPLVILFYDKLVKEITIKNTLLLLIILACMFLGGEPTIIYMTVLILFAYGLYFSRSLLSKAQRFLMLIIVLVLLLLLLAVQILPFIELANFSDRLVINSIKLMSLESFPIREVVNFLFPVFFGNPLDPGAYSEIFLGPRIQNWLLSPYIGFLPLFFVFCSLFAWKKCRRIGFWAVIGTIGMFLAFGRYTPIYSLFYKFVPGFSFIRYPVKFLFIPIFSIALLAGLGWDRFFMVENKKCRKVFGLFLLSFLLSIVYLAGKLFAYQVFSVPQETINFNLESLINLNMIVLISGSVFYGIKYSKINKKLGFFVIISIVVFDLFSVNTSLNIPIRSSFYSKITPNLALLIRDKSLYRYCSTGKLSLHNRSLYGDDYNEALIDAKDMLTENMPLINRLYNCDGYESVVLKDYIDLNKIMSKLTLDQRLRWLGALNVKYVISLYPFGSEKFPFISKGAKLIKEDTSYFYGATYVYLNKYWMPRAFLSSSYRVVSNEAHFIKTLKRKNFDPSSTLILNKDPKFDDGRMVLNKIDEVEIEKYDSDEIILRVTSHKNQLLFLSDSFYPGWKAYINGKETEIHKANYRFRAIVVIPGKQQVVFRYEPFWFKLGAIISFSFCLLTLIFVVISLRLRTNNHNSGRKKP